MKAKILILSMLLLLALSCKNEANSTEETHSSSKTEPKDKLGDLKGTWELTGFYNYKDNVVVDSFKMNPDFRQLKMYTDTKVMWCKHRPADSSEWFGYGTYKYDGDQLTEVLDFGSAVMNEVIEEKKQFIFELDLYPNKFQQIELDDEGNRIYSENYVRVE
ncbi:MAG: hypothetical protein CMO82_14450 [Winogradskyella sp.]|jgi:hypothetical protein|nr:hypothetical protein [Winogradskyella sp.]|tara:strand:- start:366 stop:848 length:483 start_codon:yes stop_codon:yes gene_type:complete